MEWIINNKEWIFSGIGAAVLGLLFASKSISQKQKGGKNSINIQAGENITINRGDKDAK